MTGSKVLRFVMVARSFRTIFEMLSISWQIELRKEQLVG